nr:PREDICTED: lysosomal-associated transmembrane protein 4B [Latimeria chalumnae]|eukprot:XP_014346936.1 PREDICTED: lysosomal-associated transmembrane protein 4B [Latimeria chalumnae]
MISPWDHWYSSSCCLCCHVRTGTIILGVWYMIINTVVLLILLTALSDPDQYHLPSAELGNEFDFMDDAMFVKGAWQHYRLKLCIYPQNRDSSGALEVPLLEAGKVHKRLGLGDPSIKYLWQILTEETKFMPEIPWFAQGGRDEQEQHAAWIIPFFCYQMFDFALNTLVALSVIVYPNTIQDYLHQLPSNFPYKEEVMSMNPTCLVVIVLTFIGIILAFKAYLIGCVWNCYRYISGRNSSDMLVYVTTNDTTILLPHYDETFTVAAKDPPPPYVSA